MQYALNEGKYFPVVGLLLLQSKSHEQVEAIQMGSTIGFTIKFKQNPAAWFPLAFNWKSHLSAQGIYHEAMIQDGHWSILQEPKGLYRISNGLRNQVVEALSNRIQDIKHLGIISALLMGNEDFLDQETESKFATAGVLHVLCVSGMHLVILYGIISGMLKPMMQPGRKSRHLVFPCMMVIIWFYALFTGLSPSITRAASMTTFIILCQWVQKRSNITNMLSASVLLLFCLQPNIFLSAGFQLSFLAVCGIFYIKPAMDGLLSPSTKPLKWLCEMTTVTLAAQIATTPLSLFLFGQFPNWFLLSNLIIVPISTLVMYGGMALVTCSNIPYLNELTTWITNFSLEMLNCCIDFFAQLPYAVTRDIHFDIYNLTFAYLCMISVIMIIHKASYINILICLLSFCLLTGTYLKSILFQSPSNLQFITAIKSEPVLVIKHNATAQVIFTEKVSKEAQLSMKSILKTKHNIHQIKFIRIPMDHFLVRQYQLLVVPNWKPNLRFNNTDPKAAAVKTLVILNSPPNNLTSILKSLPNLEYIVVKNTNTISSKDRKWLLEQGVQCHPLRESGFYPLEL